MKFSSLRHNHHTHFNQLYRKVFVLNANQSSASASVPLTTTITSTHNGSTLSVGQQNSSVHLQSSDETASQDYYFAHKRFEAWNHPKPNIQSIVFDMDGTLTIPCIDFKKMRTETGIQAPQDLLTTIHALSDENEKKRLFDIIDRIEEEANAKLAFQPHLFDLLDELLKLKMTQLIPKNQTNLVVETETTTTAPPPDQQQQQNTNSTVVETSKHFAVVTRNSEKKLKVLC
ncbi:hypothetical protein FDP41_012583 [Naegleria fowleri]|uniref:Uncharacterized protein n=1 Tax=Naegleria fowleri TaxID=5763 RepID=A0A6A5BTA7_NAEFO|nr:uncharacterized protein FDP41_012583 [Naegleria fowleri]KAF0981323.1 hypothetical protein FDP41_012583 [Naegleria fowleri]